MMESFLIILSFTLAGTIAGAVISMIPSLHIYNAAGVAVLIWSAMEGFIPYEAVAPFFLSLVVGYAFLSTLPMTLMGAPDESATATILPGTKYLMSGRGYEAVVITGIGSLLGLALLRRRRRLCLLFFLIFIKCCPRIYTGF
jgi:putative membrane protein